MYMYTPDGDKRSTYGEDIYVYVFWYALVVLHIMSVVCAVTSTAEHAALHGGDSFWPGRLAVDTQHVAVPSGKTFY